MKKALCAAIVTALLVGSAPVNAEVGKKRAMQCALPFLRKKNNCTAQEIAEGKKWLKASSIAAAVTALAAAIAAGVGVSQLRSRVAEAQAEPTLEELRTKVIEAFPARNTNRQAFLGAYENLRKAFGDDTIKTQDYIIDALPAFETEVLDKGYFLQGPL